MLVAKFFQELWLELTGPKAPDAYLYQLATTTAFEIIYDSGRLWTPADDIIVELADPEIADKILAGLAAGGDPKDLAMLRYR